MVCAVLAVAVEGCFFLSFFLSFFLLLSFSLEVTSSVWGQHSTAESDGCLAAVCGTDISQFFIALGFY